MTQIDSGPTPIPVRGKKRTVAARQELQRQSLYSRGTRQRLGDDSSARKLIKHVKARSLSRLESLPLEILELIFEQDPVPYELFAASKYIGWLFSNERYYKQFFSRAFRRISLISLSRPNQIYGKVSLATDVRKCAHLDENLGERLSGYAWPLLSEEVEVETHKSVIRLWNQTVSYHWLTLNRFKIYSSEVIRAIQIPRRLGALSELGITCCPLCERSIADTLVLDLRQVNIPRRLLKIPTDPTSKKTTDQYELLNYFFASGASVDFIESLNGDDLINLWHWAVTRSDWVLVGTLIRHRQTSPIPIHSHVDMLRWGLVETRSSPIFLKVCCLLSKNVMLHQVLNDPQIRALVRSTLDDRHAAWNVHLTEWIFFLPVRYHALAMEIFGPDHSVDMGLDERADARIRWLRWYITVI